jgi:uncharacterized protein YraI
LGLLFAAVVLVGVALLAMRFIGRVLNTGAPAVVEPAAQLGSRPNLPVTVRSASTATAVPATATRTAMPEATASPRSFATAPQPVATFGASPSLATAVPVTDAAAMASVTGDVLNLRAGPGLDQPVLGLARYGDRLQVLGGSADGAWLLVRRVDGSQGWVARSHTDYLAVAPVVAWRPPAPARPTAPVAVSGGERRWRGVYRDASGRVLLEREDAKIDFDWRDKAPETGLPSDDFRVTWTRRLALEGGTWRFRLRFDDGIRLSVDGRSVLDEYRDGPAREASVDLPLSAGVHLVELEYYEHGGNALVSLDWQRVDVPVDWAAAYWSNPTFSGRPVLERREAELDHDWLSGAPSGLPADRFSARWTRRVDLAEGTWRMRAIVDDGLRIKVDGRVVLDAWQEGPARERSVDFTVKRGLHDIVVDYFEAGGEARVKVWWERVEGYRGWRGEYFAGDRISGQPVLVRDDARIDFDWGRGSPAAEVPADRFAVRWTRSEDFKRGAYRFTAHADDGIRVKVGGKTVIDGWRDNDGQRIEGEIALDGRREVVVEYYQRGGRALAKLSWERVADPVVAATATATSPPATAEPPTPAPAATDVPPTPEPPTREAPTMVPPTAEPPATPEPPLIAP